MSSNISKERVYSTITNVLDYIRSGKRYLLRRKPHFLRLQKLSEGRYRAVVTMATAINNHYYTERDLTLYTLCSCIVDPKTHLGSICKGRPKEIRAAADLFTREQLEKDKQVVKDAIEEGALESVPDLFHLRPNGEPIVFRLVKEKTLSPYFFEKFNPMYLTEENTECIFDKSKAFIRFERIADIITLILHKGGIYA